MTLAGFYGRALDGRVGDCLHAARRSPKLKPFA